MSLDWQDATHRGVTVLTLTGHLDGEATARFVGAIGWIQARNSGRVLLDLTGLVSWSTDGEAAVLDAARRLGTQEQPLALCGIGDLPTTALTGNQAIPLGIYPDLDTALGSLTPQG
ncbi:STAS domain-containing protein [Streptomyces sp. YGL11-2]|uniref:STAS domain-containing protein n=1 Tax=Streptomyces sp. YGL11-2 TaxID=3414028 RepID=UPI003CF7558F